VEADRLLETRGAHLRVDLRGVDAGVDGTWVGTIRGDGGTPTPIDAAFQRGQFVGSNISLSIAREDEQTTIVGSFRDTGVLVTPHLARDLPC